MSLTAELANADTSGMLHEHSMVAALVLTWRRMEEKADALRLPGDLVEALSCAVDRVERSAAGDVATLQAALHVALAASRKLVLCLSIA